MDYKNKTRKEIFKHVIKSRLAVRRPNISSNPIYRIKLSLKIVQMFLHYKKYEYKLSINLLYMKVFVTYESKRGCEKLKGKGPCKGV